MNLKELDLTLGDHKRTHPDFNEKDYYLAEINGVLYFGRMVKVWFGWHFSCGFGASGGMQFDAPGFNRSRWQRIWRVENYRASGPFPLDAEERLHRVFELYCDALDSVLTQRGTTGQPEYNSSTGKYEVSVFIPERWLNDQKILCLIDDEVDEYVKNADESLLGLIVLKYKKFGE